MVEQVNKHGPRRDEVFLTAPWVTGLREVCEIARTRFPTAVQPILDALQRGVPEGIGADGHAVGSTIILGQRQRESILGQVLPYVKDNAAALFDRAPQDQARIANICDELGRIFKVKE